MVRETGHLDKLGASIGPFGLDDAQDLGAYDGVVTIHLIKVTDSKQQYRVRVFSLDIEILLHQWGLNYFCHDNRSFLYIPRESTKNGRSVIYLFEVDRPKRLKPAGDVIGEERWNSIANHLVSARCAEQESFACWFPAHEWIIRRKGLD